MLVLLSITANDVIAGYCNNIIVYVKQATSTFASLIATRISSILGAKDITLESITAGTNILFEPWVLDSFTVGIDTQLFGSQVLHLVNTRFGALG